MKQGTQAVGGDQQADEEDIAWLGDKQSHWPSSPVHIIKEGLARMMMAWIRVGG